MDNIFELLSGSSVTNIQKQYGILSDIVRDVGGKVHGSQSHIITNNNLQLIVYYEVHLGEEKRLRGSLKTLLETSGWLKEIINYSKN